MKTDESIKCILLITSSDQGQCNVFLSVAAQLLHQSGSIVHIASTETMALRAAERIPDAKFHLLPGRSMAEAYHDAGYTPEDLTHPPGYRGAIACFSKALNMMQHWSDGGFRRVYSATRALIQELRPELVVVDPICAPEIDACRSLDRKLIILSPMGLKDLLTPFQPWGAVLWKYPVLASGYPYPLPAYLIPANIYILARLVILCFITHPVLRDLSRVRTALKLPGQFPSIRPYVPTETHYLVPDLPELSLPLHYIPSNVTACGPIIPLPLASKSTTSTQELLRWMSVGKTVIVNFGTHLPLSNPNRRAIAQGLALALKKYPEMRVLWKLKMGKEPIDDEVEGVLGTALDDDRVRIVEWLDVSPAHLFMAAGVVASVHHGGANAYFETCRAGIPQIILPVWVDTYGNATCAEYLHIGIYANKTSAPGVSAVEFGDALCVILDEKLGMAMRDRAAALGRMCREKKEGRVVAAETILKMARGEM